MQSTLLNLTLIIGRDGLMWPALTCIFTFDWQRLEHHGGTTTLAWWTTLLFRCSRTFKSRLTDGNSQHLLQNHSPTFSGFKLSLIETLRSRIFVISRKPQTSRSHVIIASTSGLPPAVHVFTARARSRGKWITARFLNFLTTENPRLIGKFIP